MTDTAGQQCVVIVGGGHAGVQVAESLRAGGYAGRVVLVEGESQHPYQRPPLSKEYLAGTEGDALPLRAESFFSTRGIEILSGTHAVAIDRNERRLTLSDGAVLPWTHLVLATGAAARHLAVPGSDLDGIHELRTLDDAARLRSVLGAGRRAVVVGAGFIGLEFAAVASGMDLDVTVVEQADRALARAVGPTMAEHLVARLADAGVRFTFGAGVERFEGDTGAVSRVVTTHGVFEADLVVVGIGAQPRDELARACNLEVGGGVVVDAHLRSTDPEIYAAGDVALQTVDGSSLRLECVQNAADQGKYVAEHILGLSDLPYLQVPRFWSHQGAARLQIAGLALPDDEEVCEEPTTSGSFSVRRYRDGRLVAVESMNQPREHMLARKQLTFEHDLGGIR